MKEFLLSFTIFQLVILITGVPDRCSNGLKYSYPGDPKKFLLCENRIPLAKKCPIGTTFNENVQVCDTNSQSNSRIIQVIGGTSKIGNYGPSTTEYTEQKWTGQNVNPNNYNTQPTNQQNDFEGNRRDQSLGTGHNIQPDLNSNLSQFIYHIFPPSSSDESTNQGFGSDWQSGSDLSIKLLDF